MAADPKTFLAAAVLNDGKIVGCYTKFGETCIDIGAW